ncbi:uncharacterized protein LOC111100993 isoform X5 [Crassostrea virginica]
MESVPNHIVPFEHSIIDNYGPFSSDIYHAAEDDHFNDVHHHHHGDKGEEVLIHHHDFLPPWWAVLENWNIQDDPSDDQQEPPRDYPDPKCWKSQGRNIGLVIAALVVLALVAGALIYFFWPPPYPGDPSEECEDLPPRFGKNCEFRCHCLNLTEFCDKQTGRCTSGCMHGWLGESCQIISSVFDKTTLTARSQSRHTVTCSVYKLWYSWTYVSLAVYNETETLTLINVTQSDVITVSDQRLNATLEKSPRPEEADTVLFEFEFQEDDCDLIGLYECQFEMTENFNTSFANLSLFVQELSSNLQIWNKNEYVQGAIDNIKCSLQSASLQQSVSVIFVDRNNITHNSTAVQVSHRVNASNTNCRNWTEFVFQFNATQELHQLTAKCSMIESTSGILIESDGVVITIVSGIVNVLLEPKHQVGVLGSTVHMFCHANVSNYSWKVIHLDFKNSSLSQRLISVFYNETNKLLGDTINATVISDNAIVNISYILNIREEAMVCFMDGEYWCDIEFNDDTIHTTNDKGTLSVTVRPSITEFLVEDYYYSNSNHTLSCTATFGDNSTSDLNLQLCSDDSYKPITDYPAFFISYSSEWVDLEKCSRQKTLLYTFNFTEIINGTSLRCIGTDTDLNENDSTECFSLRLQSPVIIKMIPQVLPVGSNITSELVCSIPYKGYEWSFVYILMHSSTDSNVMLNVSNDGMINSYYSRVNGSLSLDDQFINITVVFDARPGAELCQLNQTYTCDIKLEDSLIGTVAANSTVILEIPVTNVNIHMQSQYQYGNEDWINCTTNIMDSSKASMYLEVCYNGSTFLPITNVTSSLEVDAVSDWVNCSLQRMEGYHFHFNSKANVSMRCRVDDHHFNTSLTSRCVLPNISVPLVHVEIEPKTQEGLLGSSVEIYCHANVSQFKWKVMYLDFKNTTSTQRLISLMHNESSKVIGDMLNATLIRSDVVVNISFVWHILDKSMVCLTDGEYSCHIEFFDDAIQTTSDQGTLTVSAPPRISNFLVEDHYISESNHSLSCTVVYDANSSIYLELQFCNNNTFKPITTDPLFTLRQFPELKVVGLCISQRTVLYTFNFTQVSAGLFLRCSVTDYSLNINKTTECVPLFLQPPVRVQMLPSVLPLRSNVTTALVCSIPYRGYAWSSVKIQHQNKTDTTDILSLTNNGSIFSTNSRVNGSVSMDDYFINITVVFDARPGSGLCQLNQTYTCDINLEDSLIGTVAANSTVILEIPVSAVNIHMQSQYQYGNADWINCTTDMMDSSKTFMHLEVCYNESMFLPITNVTSSLEVDVVSNWENCSLQWMESYRFHFNSKTNVSMRCRVDDHYFNTSVTSRCVLPNISVPLVQVEIKPTTLEGLLGSSVEIYCHANVSQFKWKVMHLDFKNKTSTQRLVSLMYNESSKVIGDKFNATLMKSDVVVNISFVLHIMDKSMVCLMNGEYSCHIEFFDDAIQTTSDQGTLTVSAPPRISDFDVKDHYISESNHSLGCTAIFDANSTIDLELQFCSNNSFKPITADPVFTLSQVSSFEVLGMCVRQRTVLYTFNFTQVSAGHFLRCSVTDYSLNINKTTECVPLFLQPPVRIQMLPSVLSLSSNSTTALVCSIPYRGYPWFSVQIQQQNKTDSNNILSLTKNSSVISSNSRVNGSVSMDDQFINITVVFDARSGAGLCQLNQTYTCDINLQDSLIGTVAATSTVILDIPVTDVNIHMQPHYQYGIEDWINCTAKVMESSTTSMYLEVCHNESSFLPIEYITTVLHNPLSLKSENCSLEKTQSHRFIFNSNINVSMRCRVYDHYSNSSTTSVCNRPNITTAMVYVELQPEHQTGLLRSTIEMFCVANVSNFSWKVIHLDFRNSTSFRRLVSVFQNKSKNILNYDFNATVITNDTNVNISYTVHISDEAMMCSMDGEYFCDIELTDGAIETTNNKGTLSLPVRPTITEFFVKDFYYSYSNHSLSCTASFGDNSTAGLELQLCLDDSYKPITDDPAFTLNHSSDDESGECSYRRTVSYSFSFTQVSNGTSVRCVGTDNDLNENVTTECFPLILQPPVRVQMLPSVLPLRSNVTTALVCSIPYRGYAWSSVKIQHQNKTDTTDILSLTNNGSIFSSNSRVNGSVSMDDQFINITVVFDARPGSGLCQLNQTYTCDINLEDSLIGTVAATSTVILDIPVTDVNIHMQPHYQYGIEDWINCTAKVMDSSTTSMYLEVCHNESSFLPIEYITTVLDNPYSLKSENCSLEKTQSHRFIFNSNTNVSMRCRVYDQYSNSSTTSVCNRPNITTAMVYVELQPEHQTGLIRSTIEMFCVANVSNFSWKVIHLDFRNSTSFRRLVSVFQNKSKNILNYDFNATVITNDTIVNISYTVHISDEAMMCSMDGEYSCDVELTDGAIETTNNKGTLSLPVRPTITEFFVKDYYYSYSNHSLSCTASFGDNSTAGLELQLCLDGSYKPITDDSAFTLNHSSDDESGECSYRRTVSYSFSFTQVSNGTSVRCVGTDNDLNENVTTECFPLILQPPVLVSMMPSVLSLSPNIPVELVCSIPYRGYKWSSVNILHQNSPTLAVILNVTNDGEISSTNERINGSVSISEEFINVTVSFNTSSGSGLCQLNQSYVCDIDLMDTSIGTVAANSTLILDIPVSDVNIHLQPQYEYGTQDWINCTANVMDSSAASMILEVCHNESTFLPIEDISTILENSTISMNENCSVQLIRRYHFNFDSNINVSMRCSVHDHYYNTSTSSVCMIPNITTPMVRIEFQPKLQVGLLGSTVHMFCHAYVSLFRWKVIHLQFKNSTSSPIRLISILQNNTITILDNNINATVVSKDTTVNISYILNIIDESMVCSMDGEYSCEIEFTDSAIQTTSDKGTLSVTARPTISQFVVQDYYYSNSTHNLSCTTTFGDNSTTISEIQLCLGASFKSILEDPAFTLNQSSDNEASRKCLRQKTVLYTFNFTQVSNGTSVRCVGTDSDLNENVTTECFPLILQPPVLVSMMPSVLSLRPNIPVELVCSIPYRGYKWSSVYILHQNSPTLAVILNVTNDGEISSTNERINGSVSISEEFINVTVSFNTSSGSGLCQLNQSYVCDIDLMDTSIGTVAANSTLILDIPVSDVKIHLQPQYEYGTEDWINCTAKVMDSSAASMILEVCHNESTFLPIEDISTILENSTISMNENCSVQLIRRYHFNFDSNINVSMRCSVHDHYYNTSTSSVCMIPNITTPMVRVEFQPKFQVGLLGSTVQMFCNANVSLFSWKVIHLQFKNSSSSAIKLISVLHNNTITILDNNINATVFSNDTTVNISYTLNINDESMVCSMDGKYYCEIEFTDGAIQSTSDEGTLSVTAGPTISQFVVQDYYYSNSNHSLSCTATFGDNSTTGLDIQLCLGSLYKPILEDPAFTLNQSSDNEASGKCLRQKTVSYTFSFLQVSNGTSVRCVGTDDDLKENATTECVPLILQPPVVCNMMPPVLFLSPNTDKVFVCSIPYRGYKWSSVNILQQNSSDSTVILSVSSDRMITSNHTRINGSVIIHEEYINVTVSFDSSSGSGLCQLNQSYVCDINLMDLSIGTHAAYSTLILDIPVSDVKIHLQPQYEYGTEDWINCTANVMDSSAASMFLEVCHNESTSLPVEDISTILENSTTSKNENCSVQLIRLYRFNFNSNINVSMQCRVYDQSSNTSMTSVCMLPNITTPIVRVEFQPNFQVGLLGSTVQMFCQAYVSLFRWKVIHLQFKNSSSSAIRLISVLHNNTITVLDNNINATVFSNDTSVNISYILNINDESMVCSMDGEYLCEIEFTDDAIQSTSDKGTLSVTAGPTISQFAVQDYYYSNSNHSLSCTATFGDNSTTGLDIQLCLGSLYKPILEDPAFTLNQSSDNEASGKCLRQKTVSYTFSFLQVSNGTSVRCLGTDDDLKENATTECVPLILQPPVVCNMIPPVLFLSPNTDKVFICSIPYRGYKWSSVNILQKNSSDSTVILSVSSDRMITSNHTRINGSVIINEEYINVTVSFDSSSGSGLCQLNQSYVCDISLLDTSIGTTAANSSIILDIPMSDVEIHFQTQYEYGTADWVNCTASVIDSSAVFMFLEVCHNESTFLPIEDIATVLQNLTTSKGENCSVQKMQSYLFILTSNTNVSMRCRVDNYYANTSTTSACIMPNITTPLVNIKLQPEDQVGLLGETVQMFCSANISNFTWTAIHLDLKNSSSAKRLVSVLHNETNDYIGNLINATIISNIEILNISYVFNITNETIACSMDGEYSCDIEFTNNAIQTKSNKGNLSVTARPTITEFVVSDYYFSISNHSLSCTASFGDDSTLELGLELCQNSSYKPITDDPTFTLSHTSDDKAVDQYTNQRTVAYHFNFTQVSNGTSLRCSAIAENLNITVVTNCFPVVLKSPDIAVIVEPTSQKGLQEATIEMICHANISNYKWKAIYLDYANGSTGRRLMSVLPNDPNSLIENEVNATFLSRNEIVNISFAIRVPKMMTDCTIELELSCIFEFQDETVEMRNDTGTVIVQAPPRNLAMELQGLYLKYETGNINCTATLNPNTTKVFLIGKNALDQIIVIPTTEEITFVEPATKYGCNSNVRVEFKVAYPDLTQYSPWACMVEDKDYSKNLTSEFRIPDMQILN